MCAKYWSGQAISVLAVALLAGCGSAPEKPAPEPNEATKLISPNPSGIRIGHPRDGFRPAFGYYVLIKKSGDSWSVESIESAGLFVRLMDPTARTGQDGEVLYVSEDLKYVRPDFYVRESAQSPKEAGEGRYTCFMVGFDDDKKTYYPNACNSDLTSTVEAASNMAKQAMGAIVTLGLSTLAANKTRSVDPAKVLAAMESAGVVDRVKKVQYTRRFKEATTSRQLQQFVDRYRDYDPDGLVSKAQVALPVQIEKERLLTEQRARDEALAADKHRREAEAAADARLRRAQQLELRTAQFRKSLQPGDASHCGLVIEVKRPLVKLQTMIGEYWMRIDQLYGAGDRDCRFINGQYTD